MQAWLERGAHAVATLAGVRVVAGWRLEATLVGALEGDEGAVEAEAEAAAWAAAWVEWWTGPHPPPQKPLEVVSPPPLQKLSRATTPKRKLGSVSTRR
eukprot:7382243-Prymnesium_polylepis.1